jgi:ELWxxDGT repeat protein
MDKLYRFLICLIVAASCLPTSLVYSQLSPTPTTVYVSKLKEINPTGSGVPSRFIEFGGKVYFSANDGINGNELWVTDGTEAGTVLFKNINPGGDSSPNGFTIMNGVIYFSANDGVNGDELWKTDGTASGTQLVRNINPAGANAYPSYLVANGTMLFFFANNGTNGRELWKTDGTANGTRMVKEINPTGQVGDFPSPVLLNGKLYFAAKEAEGNIEFWVSDGTEVGTKRVKEINPTGSAFAGFPAEIQVCNGLVYFVADDGVHGQELWKSDGTSAGTTLVKDIWTSVDPNTDSPKWLTAVGTTLFFTARSSFYGTELWKSDGTSTGTVQVRNINLSGNSSPYGLVSFQNQLFFAAFDSDEIVLWKSDGTANGTQKVSTVEPVFITVAGNYLYFDHAGPWRSDGTSEGTRQLGPQANLGYDSNRFIKLGTKVLFSAKSMNSGSASSDYELYKISPCTACPIGSREGISQEPPTELTLTLLHNPTPDAVRVEVSGVTGQPLSLQLVTLLGQPIESKSIETAQALERHQFNIRSLPNGILLLRAISGNRSQTVRVSKTD